MTAPIDGIPEAIRRDQVPPIVQGITWRLGAWVDSAEVMCPHCFSDDLRWIQDRDDAGLGRLLHRHHLEISPITVDCDRCGHVWNVSTRGVADYLHYVLAGKSPDERFAPLRVIARYYNEGADG